MSDCLKGPVIWFYELSDVNFVKIQELLLSTKWYP